MDQHTVTVGLGFGDEGKGTTVDWLCAENSDVRAVIRYNGGAQAAHNVVLPDGRHHTFAQWGSGTFHGVETHLSEYVLVNPFNLVPEAEHLQSLGVDWPWRLLTISERALLITPYHREANRVRERRRGRDVHGSCGQGIGETRDFSFKHPLATMRVGDIRDMLSMSAKLAGVRHYLEEDLGEKLENVPSSSELAAAYATLRPKLKIVPQDFSQALLNDGPCVFEGAQGVLLDETYGFTPYTTWTDTTAQNARLLLGPRDSRTLGITRTYMTRHGPGPFPSEIEQYWWDRTPRRLPAGMEEHHNAQNEWQGAWRVGYLDLSLLNYAIRATRAVDEIVLTHCDRVPPHGWETTFGYLNYYNEGHNGHVPLPARWDMQEDLYECTLGVASGYNMITGVDSIAEDIAAETDIEPTIFSYGPTWKDKTRELVKAVA